MRGRTILGLHIVENHKIIEKQYSKDAKESKELIHFQLRDKEINDYLSESKYLNLRRQRMINLV